MTSDEIAKIAKAKKSSVEDLQKSYLSGLKEEKRKIADFKDEEMKNAQFAFVYGLH